MLALALGVLVLAAPFETAPLQAQFDYGSRAPADRFRQLEELLPTPTRERTASGAPGEDYWQQTVDYEIDVELDDATQEIRGHAKIRYQNDSPHPLDYLWLQLDANIFKPDSDASLTRTTSELDEVPFTVLEALLASNEFDGGCHDRQRPRPQRRAARIHGRKDDDARRSPRLATA